MPLSEKLYAHTLTVSSVTTRIEGSPLLRLSLEGGLDWSPTARVQRGSSETASCTSTGDHLAGSLIFQACSFSLQGWELIDLPPGATYAPAHWQICSPAYPPIASNSISRDVPLSRAKTPSAPIRQAAGVASIARIKQTSLFRLSLEGGLDCSPSRMSICTSSSNSILSQAMT